VASEPHLFFTSSELADLTRRRKADSIGRQLFYELMAAANWCRKQPIPAQPDLGPDVSFKPAPFTPGESPYSDEYLLSHEAFEVATFAFERSVQQMSFAHLLTGDERWAARAVAWLDAAMNEWQLWGPRANPLDQFGVRVMSTAALGCDWLGDGLPEELRERCRERVTEFAGRCLREWGESLDRPEPHQISNHYWFNVGMLGLTALWLGGKDPSWRGVADRGGRQLERMCEWVIGPDGDYNDKPGYLLYAFRWSLPMLVAWHHAGGPDVLSKPRLAAAAEWLCDMPMPGDLNLADTPWGFFDRWIYLLLAAKHRDGRAQWIGLETTDSPVVRHEPPYFRWTRTDGVWPYLFYDETLAPTPPEAVEAPPARQYRWSGWALLSRDRTESTPTVLLHAGPASAKNYHNQGELLVSAYGDRLLQIPELPSWDYISEHRAIALLMSNLSGAVLVADGLGQAGGRYPAEWPGNELIGHPVAPSVGRIVSVESGDGWSRVTADVTSAYRSFDFQGLWGVTVAPLAEWEGKEGDRLVRFLRHVLCVGPEWIILQDDIETRAGRPVDLEWHFGTHAAVTIRRPGEATLAQPRAALDVFLVRPAEAALSVRRAHFSDTGKWLTVRLFQHEGAISLVLALRVRRRTGPTQAPSHEEGTIRLPDCRKVVLGAGGAAPHVA